MPRSNEEWVGKHDDQAVPQHVKLRIWRRQENADGYAICHISGIPIRPTFAVTIFVAGDLVKARQTCRKFCMRGLCVTVEPCDFVYTGGCEAGVRVGLLNYPRFPKSAEDILALAEQLADWLRDDLCQESWLIVTPDETIWNTTRKGTAG